MKFNKDYLFKQEQKRMMSLGSMTPKGITVHNTANRNHASARQEAANVYNNNTRKGTAGVAVHLFVDENETYQVLPFNVHGWHASDGRGFGNKQTISIEICRSLDYTTERYAKAEKRTAELVAWLMKEFNIPLSQVKRHYDYDPGKQKCPHRMFEGKPNTWSQFLQLVKEAEKGTSKPIIPSNPVSTLPIDEIVKKVKRGDYGNGLERVINLEKAGYNYNEVMAAVNESIYGVKPKPKPVLKSNAVIAAEVWKGKWGNGKERIDRLTKAGYNAKAVQAEVDKSKSKPKPVLKSNREIALEIYRGVGGWGNNPGRRNKLEAAGYDYKEIQKIVNSLF